METKRLGFGWMRLPLLDPNDKKTVDMEPYPDGTWCCALAEDGANYTVVGITKYGSVSIASNNYVRANAPWFDEDGVRIADSGDGTYSISFTLRDDRYDLKKNAARNHPYA